MLATRVFSFALFFVFYITSAFALMSWTGVLKPRDILWCEKYRNRRTTGEYNRLRPPVPPAQDCYDALVMIPRGAILDPDYLQQIGLDAAGRIPFLVDKRKYALPAVFRSGRCLVRVFTVRGLEPAPGANGGWPLQQSASHMMYGTIWPMAAAAAEEVVKRCMSHRRTDGSWMYDMHTPAGDWVWHVQLEFTADDTQIGKNGGKDFNVYNSTLENRKWDPGSYSLGYKEKGKDGASTPKH